jgi:hypothetical protein
MKFFMMMAATIVLAFGVVFVALQIKPDLTIEQTFAVGVLSSSLVWLVIVTLVGHGPTTWFSDHQ